MTVDYNSEGVQYSRLLNSEGRELAAFLWLLVKILKTAVFSMQQGSWYLLASLLEGAEPLHEKRLWDCETGMMLPIQLQKL